MPPAIIAAVATAIGSFGVAAGVASFVATALVYGAIAATAYFAQSLFAPKPRALEAGAPQDGQQSTRQSIQVRRRAYGRVFLSGNLQFMESKDGVLYQMITVCDGPVDAIEEYWLGDLQVTLDGNSFVTNDKYVHANVKRVELHASLGTADQDSMPRLREAFAEWTTDHRSKGVVNVLGVFHDVPQSAFSGVYGGGAPQVKVVLRGAKVFDPRDGGQDAEDPDTWVWSDNAGLCILDYLTHADGYRIPRSKINTASFIAFADLCDEDVARKIGGTEKRYRLWGYYDLTEDRKAVLRRMLATCDGRIAQAADGRIEITGGQWTEPDPSAAIDDAKGHVLSYTLQQGSGKLAAFNVLKATYVDSDQGYQAVETEAWRDETAIALAGEDEGEPLRLYMVPSHGQARRLLKIAMYRRNPLWAGTVMTNMFGLNVMHEPAANFSFSDLAVNTSFAINSFRFNDNGTGFEVGIASLGPDAFDWNPETEEGTAPPIPADTAGNFNLAPPDGIAVSAGHRDIDGATTGVYAIATWTEPSRDSFSHDGRIRETGGAWETMSIAPGENRAVSGILADGRTYEVQIRTVTAVGRASDWSASETLIAQADATAPGVVTSLSASAGAGVIDVDWTQPSSANAVGARIYLNTVDDFATATLDGTEFAGPSQAANYQITGLAAGDYWVFVAAINGSDVEGAETGTGQQTVT